MQAWTDFKNLEIGELFGAALVALIFLLASTIAFNLVAATGEIDYCYFDTTYMRQPNYTLKAHRRWRPDVELGNFPSFEDALVAAGKVECPLLRIK